MEDEYPQKRKPPPIPKRNPSTRLSAVSTQRTSTLSRSFDHEPARRRSYPNQNQLSATLPRRSQRLDICAELLNYISELTQELMAETSFTEVSVLEDSNEPSSPSPKQCSTHTSIAIQTESLYIDDEILLPKGRSIGTQMKNGVCEESHNRQGAANDFAKLHKSPSKPFKDIRKMLKEGSIEGIEEEPPIFKPPPPPVAYVIAQSSFSTVKQLTFDNKKTAIKHSNSKVHKCLSTFEPTKSNTSARKDPLQENHLHAVTNLPAFTATSPGTSVSSSNINYQQYHIENTSTKELNDQQCIKPSRSLAFSYKAATIDQCLNQRLSPITFDKQSHASGTPPPPPVGKEPPPKIVVEVPPKKHRQNSSCSTTCSCLCLKRQSPCSSPVPSQGSHAMSSPLTKRHAQYSPTSKRWNEDRPLYHNGGSSGQEAYDALIAEIRSAIKRRQTDLDKDEDTFED